MEQYVFWPTAVLALASALLMLFSTNAVHSALALVVNFFTLAVFYILLDAPFLAAVQVIVYAGAIMVLFLFVIMLLGVDRQESLLETIKGQRVAAFALAGVLAAIVVFTLRTAFDQTPFAGLEQANRAGNTEGIGRLLFSRYVWPFEVTALLLIVATIGATVIGKRRASRDAVAQETADVSEENA
ncbi:MAG TPA: NADH-quinone oxidoreductase subunit J [Actinomycetota bacterium]